MPSISELSRSSSFIFSGTVIERGRSTVPHVPSARNLVSVRLDRALRVDPVLGDLRGKTITVAARALESLSPGESAVFFANSWVHGQGIAVREVGHVDLGQEAEVATAVARLPEMHLIDRLSTADLVADAEVVQIRPVERTSWDRNHAFWAAAQLRLNRVLRGQPRQSAEVYFPTAQGPQWRRAPQFHEKQRGLFILHDSSRGKTISEKSLPAGSLVALDTADFQPESQLQHVERLLAGVR
jgi:hypothetical protein